jgi:hypothetical protein
LTASGTAIADSHTVAVPASGHNADVLANFFPATQGKLFSSRLRWQSAE